MAHVQPMRTPDRLLRHEILAQWKELTNADVEECGTDLSKLTELVQARYGYAKRRAEREVELFFGDFQTRLRLAA